jgi:Pyruvate/2-oxoacid:ferredoxin oxidoreductase delta subunit
MAYTITHECVGCSVCVHVCPVNAIVGKPQKRHQVLSEVCIDCGACGRVCPHASVHDPDGRIVDRIRIRSRWPQPVFDNERCMGCTICVETCPTGCIALSTERGTRETIRCPRVNEMRDCIGCGFCKLECPVDAIEMVRSEG